MTKSKKIKRDKQLKIRCTEEEKKKIIETCNKLGFESVSDYARVCLMNGPNIEHYDVDLRPCLYYLAALKEARLSLQWIANRCAGTGNIYYDDVLELSNDVRDIETMTKLAICDIEERGKYHASDNKT